MIQGNLFDKNQICGGGLPDFIGNATDKAYELGKQALDIEKRINEVLNMGIQESIALREIIEHGSTTVHDLGGRINAPHGVLRDIQKTFGIPLDYTWETRPIRKFYKGKVCERTERYKRYFLAKFE